MEDLRLDEWAKRRYPGLRGGYQKIQRAALHDRPATAAMGPRNALAEIMVAISLGGPPTFTAPALLHEPIRQMAQLMRPLVREDARVEDSAEAAMRAYCLLVGLPNMEADYGPATAVDMTQPASIKKWPTVWPEPEKTRLEGDDVLATVMAPVGYRDQLARALPITRAPARWTSKLFIASPRKTPRPPRTLPPTCQIRNVPSPLTSRWSATITTISARMRRICTAANCTATNCCRMCIGMGSRGRRI